MDHLKAQLAVLHKNLNTLREREAKYGSNAPLELLNQIDDHQTAIALTEQALKGELSETEWRAALEPMLVAINTRLGEAAVSRVTIGNVSGGIHDSIIAGGNVSITNIYQSGQAKPKQADRPPFMVEDLPPDFVPRPAELEPLLAHLLGGSSGGTVALTTALRGAGGYGKTTLAKAVCHEASIKQAFADGIPLPLSSPSPNP